MKLSFLLDTNVIIQFEEVGSDRKIRGPFQKLHSSLTEHSLQFRYHPLTENDLNNDTNKDRQTEMLSRLMKYPKLESPPTADGKDLEKLFGGISNTNDLIDCQLLFALKRNCTTYLVSEDKGLHKRVANTDLDERVLYVEQAIEIITRQYKPETVKLPNINLERLYNLDMSIPFFDSLKADYVDGRGGFEGWIKRNSDRNCWTIKIDDELAGLCIYKHDDKAEHDGILMPSMKLSTFKVSDDFSSRKLGELLLKMAHQHAVKNKMATMWVTAHERQEKLIAFLKKFGFLVHKDMKGKDMIFYKLMQPPPKLPLMDPMDFHKFYSPHFYDHAEIKKYVIPIQSEFHDILFPEVAPEQMSQLAFDGLQRDNTIAGNTIRKVYLCHSKIKVIPQGSIIYFYRSKPEQYVHTFGIVERARRLTDMESLAAAIGKRSVYSREQVEEMIKKEVLVIDFRLISHSEKPIRLLDIVSKNIFNKRPPQSVAELEHSKYQKLKKLWQKANN